MDTKQTAAYCRTALADESAMRAQERKIHEYADKPGYGEPMFYRDCGQSGLTLDRPAMNALTADVKAGKIGAVIAADTARIARNYALVSEWLDMLSEYGVDFVTTADGKFALDNEISYIRAGDYLIPNIALSDPPGAPPLGYYGLRHKAYLREHRPILYSRLLMSERLYPLCREVDEAARTRLRTIPSREQAH
ncbi:MAG: TnpV protein, partial [Clostridiales Family XIII bacterium]|nr:TnpV protein [Clostridiales Family XIII bacterium]